MPRLIAVALLALALLIGVSSVMPAPVSAQSDSAEFTANETAGDIDRIRTSLLSIAAVTGAMLVVYIWHTNPRRRLDAAVRRRENRERRQMESLEDVFMLPADAGAVDDGSARERGEARVEPET